VPRYDYTCENGHIVEVMHGVNELGPTRCAQCGRPMRKLISKTAIVFKGSGWAKKDRSSGSAGAVKSATDTDTDHRPSAGAEKDKSKPAGDSKPAQSADSAGSSKTTTDTSSSTD
jgi:putative FmdB family regulatory protein